MSIEQRAHDLTMLYIEIINKYKTSSDTDKVEINLIEDYLKFYPIVLDQIREDFTE